MDIQFAKELMEKTGFPREAMTELLSQGEKLTTEPLKGEFAALLKYYRENNFLGSAIQDKVDALAGSAGMHPYTLWLLVLIECAGQVKPAYMEKGVSEKIFWDTFADLKYKLWECWDNYGIWGNFVAFWYGIFFRADIVKLGRLEYEYSTYDLETPYVCGEHTVRKGDPVLSIHIPSSCEPFDREAVMESLRLAHAFFGKEVLICKCHSWLLYPGYEEVWPQGGNVRSFRSLFDVISSGDSEEFGDGWRVFSAAWGSEPDRLPEKTSMHRSFKKHILSGGKHGSGDGMLLFDGKNIINK